MPAGCACSCGDFARAKAETKRPSGDPRRLSQPNPPEEETTVMFQLTPARSRLRRAAGVAAGTLMVAVVAAGCGSSSSSSSGSNASSANSNSNVGAAQQVVSQAMQRPGAITVSKPVGKTVPSGKKVAFISCGVSVCQIQGQIVAQAAKALGWTTTTVTTDGTPTSVQAAYDTALRQGANAIVTTAALRAEVASKLPKLQANGIVVSNCCTTDPVAAPFIYNTSTPSQAAVDGKILAAEVVADSKGKANTLYVNIPA